MMYILPQNFECNKCKFSFIWGPHYQSPYPTIPNESLDDSSHFARVPICPQCWHLFLKENIGYGIMQHEKNNE